MRAPTATAAGRALACPLVLVAMAVGACGGDEHGAGRAASTGATAGQTQPGRAQARDRRTSLDADQPFVDQEEAFQLLRRAGLRLQHIASGAAAARNVVPAPVAYGRYAEKSGAQFDLFVFFTPDEAHRAVASVRGGRAVEATATGVNLLVAFPRQAGANVRDRVAGLLRRLEVACGHADGDKALRGSCFTRGAPGDTVAGGRADALPAGSTMHLGDFTYTVELSRLLNPNIAADGQLLGGRRPAAGRAWFAAFLRVCNVGAAAARPTATIALVSTPERRTAPERLPGGAFGPPARRVEAGACVPRTSTLADSVKEGAALVFDVPSNVHSALPLFLDVQAAGGTARSRLDV